MLPSMWYIKAFLVSSVTVDQEKKSITESARQIYDALGGTLYEIFK